MGKDMIYQIETPVLGRMNSENLEYSKDIFKSKDNSKDLTSGTIRERSKTDLSFMSQNREGVFASDMCQEELINKNYDKKMSYNLEYTEDKSFELDDDQAPRRRIKSKKKNKLNFDSFNMNDSDSNNIE